MSNAPDKTELRNRANRGATFLDKLFEGQPWWEGINLEKFVISNGCMCVIGQLFEHFRRVTNVGTEAVIPEPLTREQTRDLGFDAPTDELILTGAPEQLWDTLQACWEEIILDRRASHVRHSPDPFENPYLTTHKTE